MVGAVARNPHAGTRSEILADYLFSGAGGTVTRSGGRMTRRNLYCTLTAEVGQRSIVTDSLLV